MTHSPANKHLARFVGDSFSGPHFLESNDDCAPMDWSGFDCGECDFDANGSICAESGDEEHSILIPRDNAEVVVMNVRLFPSL